jgi:hypothetical protein
MSASQDTAVLVGEVGSKGGFPTLAGGVPS